MLMNSDIHNLSFKLVGEYRNIYEFFCLSYCAFGEIQNYVNQMLYYQTFSLLGLLDPNLTLVCEWVNSNSDLIIVYRYINNSVSSI